MVSMGSHVQSEELREEGLVHSAGHKAGVRKAILEEQNRWHILDEQTIHPGEHVFLGGWADLEKREKDMGFGFA